MEVHHEGVDGEELQRHLDRLPEEVVQIILEKVFIDQPFSQISDLCNLDERWTDLLLSNQYLLYFDMDQLLLFSFRRSVWETVSLEFLPLQELKLLNFVASDGGLVCLLTECGEFIVCNPLTKRFKRLLKPSQGLYQHCVPSALHFELCFLTDIVASSDDLCHFKLVLNVHGPLVYFSRESNHWREIEDGAGYEGNCFSHVVLAIRGPVRGTGFTGNIRVDTYFEVRDMRIMPSTFGLPASRVVEALVHSIPDNLAKTLLNLLLFMYHVPGEDVVTYLGILISPSAAGTIHVQVCKHNLLDDSVILSDLEEWRWPLAFGSSQPLVARFKPFKPTLKFCD